MGPNISAGDEFPARARLAPAQPFGGHPFDLRVEQAGTTFYLRLTGEFDAACVGRVEAAFERISEAQTTRVVFDLRGLSFLDLAGLRTILRADDRARSAPFDVAVIRPRGFANRVFTLTRAGAQLKLVDQIPQSWSPKPSRGWSA